MYYPFFRGKQYELVCVRENAGLLASSRFVPILEPVRQALSGLDRALDALMSAGASAIVIVNPEQGEHSGDTQELRTLLEKYGRDSDSVVSGVILTADTSIPTARELLESVPTKRASIVHSGFAQGKELRSLLPEFDLSSHVFVERHCSKLYRRNFTDHARILLRDGFKVQPNKSYPEYEPFSDLHVTYPDEGVEGFGDYLIVGDHFREAGGPAWTVAIHITCIDPDRDFEMFVHHFKSVTNDTPTDPAGKFSEALDQLILAADDPDSLIEKTEAIAAFRQLHKDRHFPGLGFVKKLSMAHHIETLANYFRSQSPAA